MKRTLIVLVLLAFGLVGQIFGYTWSFDYSGVGVSANGYLTTGAFDAGFNGYEITGISGTRNGVAIDGLVPNPNFPGTSNSSAGALGWYIFFDNGLTSVAGLSNPGLYYTSGGTDYNVYSEAGGYRETNLPLLNTPPAGGSVALTSFTVSQVPDGGLTLVLFGGAMAGIVALRRRLSVS